MLFTLMYHRVGQGKHANAKKTLNDHFSLLRRYPCVLPGDPLTPLRTSVCLTFDDATFDFYHIVYPLLKKWNLRALLGVPVCYIQERTKTSAEERISIPYTLAMQEGIFEEKSPFCTWQEMEEMVSTGHVEIASHSFAHCNLTFSFVDLAKEVVESKKIIESRLRQTVSSFIYPFGKVTRELHAFVMRHYLYAFRIGSGMNWSWECHKSPLFRIRADNTAAASLLDTKMKSFSLLKSCTRLF